MDVGDHSKIQAPVHVCHKCGWPFPNSHPSARHRRAHKKLCGTLEGYKLFVSNDSDDGNHSDEDYYKTPSPRLLERSANGKGSGGIGNRSNRSEDEVFTDAAAEFSDSSGFSPGVEECSMDATKSVTITERVANYDSSSNQSVNDIAITDIIQPHSSLTDIYQVKNHEVPYYNTDQLEITLQYEDDTPTDWSMVNSVTGSTAEELVTILSSDSSSPLCNSDPNKFGKPAYDTLHERETKVGETVKESSSNVHEQDDYPRRDLEVKFDSVLEDTVIEHGITEVAKVAPTLEKTKEHDAYKMSTSGSYPDIGPVKLSDASFDTAQTNVSAAQITDTTRSNCIGDREEGIESVHVLSVPEDVYVVDHPETILEGFKGHKGLKLHQPMSSDSCKRIEDEEANLRSPICEKNSSGLQSKQLSGGSDVPILEDNWDDRGCKFSVKEVPFEGVVSLAQATASDDENSQSDVVVTAYAATVEMKNILGDSYSKEEIPCDIFNDSSQEIFPDAATEVVPVENFIETHMEAKVNERLDMSRNENSAGVSGDDSTENIVETHNSPSNMSEFQVNPIMGYSVGNEGHCTNGKYNVSENRGFGRPLEENVSMNTKAIPEFACNLQDSPVSAVGGREGSNGKVSEIGCTRMDTVSSGVGTDVSNIQGSEGDKIHGSNTLQAQYVGRVSMPSELHHGEEFVTFQKASEYHIVEEGVVLTQISAVEERGNNIATQHSDAADVSIHSCSRTESLPSTEALAPAETTNLRKVKVELHRQCSDKSDICEPPSFSTLAEPGAVTGQKDDCSDIQAQQIAQHSISAPAQPGWFPSLTHVVNDSPGRKKNEEIIGKVTDWSSLTLLMSETKPKSRSPIPVVAQKDDKEATTANFPSLTDVVNETKPKSSMPKESPIPVVAQNDGKEAESPAAQATTESGKELNSPAKYTSEIKREKRKDRPIWAPFICCYSANSD